jgi:hypothetical protein
MSLAMTEERPPMSQSTIVKLIVGGLILWGLYVAAGVIWYDLNVAGAFVVLLCVGMFVGFWLLLLRTKRQDREE